MEIKAMRALLAGDSDDRWRPYRQRQWIGVVRRDPAAALRDRLYFDIDEDSYRDCLLGWPKAGLPREEAIARFLASGAIAVAPPES